MMNWKYKIKNGIALREAIDDGNLEQIRECLLLCYKELLNKLSDEDTEIYRCDIEDEITFLESCESDITEEGIDDYLAKFYDICDDAKAFVEL